MSIAGFNRNEVGNIGEAVRRNFLLAVFVKECQYTSKAPSNAKSIKAFEKDMERMQEIVEESAKSEDGALCGLK